MPSRSKQPSDSVIGRLVRASAFFHGCALSKHLPMYLLQV